MEEKLLYESKGCSFKITICYVVTSIICLGMCIMAFYLSEFKKTSVLGGLYSNGYLFPEEVRNIFKVLGFVNIMLLSMGIANIFSLRTVWVKIYENHIEGTAWGGFFANKKFFCVTADIRSYEEIKGIPFPIVLNTLSGKLKVVCKEREKACVALQTIIKR